MTTFQKGDFHAYRASISFHVGALADNLAEGTVIWCDGSTVRMDDGREFQIPTSTFRSAVAKNWLVSANDSSKARYEPVGVRRDSSTENAAPSFTPVVTYDDMQEVGSVAAHKAARTQGTQTRPVERHATTPLSEAGRGLLAELDAAFEELSSHYALVDFLSPPPPQQPPPKSRVLDMDGQGKVVKNFTSPSQRANLGDSASSFDESQVVGQVSSPSPVYDDEGSQGRLIGKVAGTTKDITLGDPNASWGVEATTKQAARLPVSDGAESSDGVPIMTLGSANFGKTMLSDGAQGSVKVGSAIRPKLVKSANAQLNELRALKSAILDGTISKELLERLDPEKVKAAMQVDDAPAPAAPVEEDSLEDLLPEAETSSSEAKKFKAARKLVPDFEWDMSRSERERAKDAIMTYRANKPWLQAIMTVEAPLVVKSIQAMMARLASQ